MALARENWPALRGRPELAWLVLRKTPLHHAGLAAVLIAIHFGTPLLLEMIDALLGVAWSAPGDWMLVASAGATLTWGVAVWLSTPRILNLEDLRAHGLEIRASHRAKQDLREGLELYRLARRHAVSRERRNDIEQKIGRLEAALEHLTDRYSAPATVPTTLIKAESISPPSEHSAEPIARADITFVDPVCAPGPSEESQPEAVGPDGRYQLHRELGRGGMGVVFQATDEVLGRGVALKQLPAQTDSAKEMTERFRQEARALASLSHPNVVQIFDLFEHDDQLWIAMELVLGGDLAHQMDQCGSYSAQDAFDIVVPIARGLAAAHARGIVHRDIKPMNILIAEDQTPKLTDFGLAKLMETSVHTVLGAAMGSPPYMSPELAAGEVANKATDMYSLGITLYELLSTHTPFEGSVSEVMAKHITQAPPPLAEFCPNLAPEISELVASMLEKDPKTRLNDMNQFVSRVEAIGPFADT